MVELNEEAMELKDKFISFQINIINKVMAVNKFHMVLKYSDVFNFGIIGLFFLYKFEQFRGNPFVLTSMNTELLVSAATDTYIYVHSQGLEL